MRLILDLMIQLMFAVVAAAVAVRWLSVGGRATSGLDEGLASLVSSTSGAPDWTWLDSGARPGTAADVGPREQASGR